MSGLGELYPSLERLGLGGAFAYVGPGISSSSYSQKTISNLLWDTQSTNYALYAVHSIDIPITEFN